VARQEAGFPALGDYVEATQVELAGPLPALQEFYRNFVETLADLKPLAEKEGVVAQILSQYVPEPPGSAKERTVTGYLDAVGSLAPHMIRTGLGLACLRRALELPQVRQRLASLELELPDEVEKATEQELLRQVVASTRPAFEHGFCELAQLATGAPSSQQARRREGSQAQSRGGAQAWLAGAATAVRLVGDAATGRSSPARGRGQVGGGRLGRDGHSDGTPGANLGDAEENGGR
jgi:hypothetical protein